MSDKVVVDASVAVKWVIPEDYSDDAVRLRNDFLDGKIEVHAPEIIPIEVASALRKYHLRGIIDKDVAEKALSLIVRSDIILHKSSLDRLLEALNISFDLGISIYDAVYIELTRELEAFMYTADDKLLRNREVRDLGIVRHIKDYP